MASQRHAQPTQGADSARARRCLSQGIWPDAITITPGLVEATSIFPLPVAMKNVCSRLSSRITQSSTSTTNAPSASAVTRYV